MSTSTRLQLIGGYCASLFLASVFVFMNDPSGTGGTALARELLTQGAHFDAVEFARSPIRHEVVMDRPDLADEFRELRGHVSACARLEANRPAILRDEAAEAIVLEFKHPPTR